MINLTIRYSLDSDGFTIYFSNLYESITYYIYTTRSEYLTRWYIYDDVKEINHNELFNICIKYLKENKFIINNRI